MLIQRRDLQTPRTFLFKQLFVLHALGITHTSTEVSFCSSLCCLKRFPSYIILQGANGCYIETCKWDVILETCDELCNDTAALNSKKFVHSHKSAHSVGHSELKKSTPWFLGDKTFLQGLVLPGPSSVDSFAPNTTRCPSFTGCGSQFTKSSKCDLISQEASKEARWSHRAQKSFEQLQECHSVNGICLEDLEAFEAQLKEVKNVKACLLSSKSESMPILKATVLGSRSASSLTKHPKNLNITNPRLSLSWSSQMNKRESSQIVALSDKCLQCPPDSSMSISDKDAIRLSKVHKA